MIDNGLDSDYVSFISQDNGVTSFWVGTTLVSKNKDMKAVYYPEIEPILDEIFKEYPELAEGLTGIEIDNYNSDVLYEALGMTIKK